MAGYLKINLDLLNKNGDIMSEIRHYRLFCDQTIARKATVDEILGDFVGSPVVDRALYEGASYETQEAFHGNGHPDRSIQATLTRPTTANSRHFKGGGR